MPVVLPVVPRFFFGYNNVLILFEVWRQSLVNWAKLLKEYDILVKFIYIYILSRATRLSAEKFNMYSTSFNFKTSSFSFC